MGKSRSRKNRRESGTRAYTRRVWEFSAVMTWWCAPGFSSRSLALFRKSTELKRFSVVKGLASNTKLRRYKVDTVIVDVKLSTRIQGFFKDDSGGQDIQRQHIIIYGWLQDTRVGSRSCGNRFRGYKVE